ncbi:MAG: class 1 fructose-bisphosphatase, partial [Nostoc sp.]
MTKAPESLDLSTYEATDKSLDRDCTTLSRHVLQQLQSFS